MVSEPCSGLTVWVYVEQNCMDFFYQVFLSYQHTTKRHNSNKNVDIIIMWRIGQNVQVRFRGRLFFYWMPNKTFIWLNAE